MLQRGEYPFQVLRKPVQVVRELTCKLPVSGRKLAPAVARLI
jgi:hypothetical protein